MPKLLVPVALLLAVVAAGCGSFGNVQGPKAYRVWCNTEHRYLSEWLDSKEAAEKVQEKHHSRWPWHAVRIDIAAQADVADRLVRTKEGEATR